TSRATANTATATTGTSLPTVPAPNTCARTAAPSSRAIETATTSTTRAGAIATAARTAPTAGMATIAAIPATTRRAASTRSRGADAVVHRDVRMGRGFPPHRSLGHDGPPVTIGSRVSSPAKHMTKSRHYWKEIAAFKQQLCDAIPLEELRMLHERDPRR